LIQSYKEAQELPEKSRVIHPTKWKSPNSGMLKSNFEGGAIGDDG